MEIILDQGLMLIRLGIVKSFEVDVGRALVEMEMFLDMNLYAINLRTNSYARLQYIPV